VSVILDRVLSLYPRHIKDVCDAGQQMRLSLTRAVLSLRTKYPLREIYSINRGGPQREDKGKQKAKEKRGREE